MSNKDEIESYIFGLKDVFSRLPIETIDQIVNLLMTAYDNEQQVFTMGNGGHGSTASHFINDLVKHTIVSEKKDRVVVTGKRFKAMCLNDSMVVLTTWANDLSYEDCFSQQLINWVKKGDLVFGFSASGNSKNILKAFDVAKRHQAISICFTGGDGGKAKDVADICLIVPTRNYLFLEDAHLSIVHILSNVVRLIIQRRNLATPTV